MKHLQGLRHSVQLLVLISLVAVPFWVWTQHAAPASAHHDAAAPFVQGNIWALNLGAVAVVDPLALADSTAASRSVWVKGLVGLAIPLLVTVLLGRVFCSWVCPAGALFEFGQWVRKGLRRLGFSPRELRRPSERLKYWVLGGGLLASACVGIPVLLHLYPPAILSRELHRVVVGHLDGMATPVTLGVLFLLLIWVLEVTVSTRFWCRYVCPGGALYGLIGALRPVRVRFDATSCSKCMDCVVVCPMGLDPVNGRMGKSCDNCLACVSVCASDSLPILPSRYRGDVEGRA